MRMSAYGDNSIAGTNHLCNKFDQYDQRLVQLGGVWLTWYYVILFIIPVQEIDIASSDELND
jgi:hypothetical protein